CINLPFVERFFHVSPLRQQRSNGRRQRAAAAMKSARQTRPLPASALVGCVPSIDHIAFWRTMATLDQHLLASEALQLLDLVLSPTLTIAQSLGFWQIGGNERSQPKQRRQCLDSVAHRQAVAMSAAQH